MHQEPTPARPASVVFQTVLFDTPADLVHRTLEALDNTASIGTAAGFSTGFEVVLGDASPRRSFSEELVASWRAEFTGLASITYLYFDENTGTSRGHNRMARESSTDVIVVGNPDVVPEPRAVWRMLAVLNDPEVGMVEAKQLPIEHPKDYRVDTGFTSWASGAFFMTPRAVWDRIDGFDAETFFMYCDDVDYSWRVREAGFQVVSQPAAAVFHDKSLTIKGRWVPTETERRLAPEAALLLAHKWSRDDVLADLIELYSSSGSEHHRDAVRTFEELRAAGRLVPQRDAEHKVGTFLGTTYEKHRFGL